jgi:hypothetical protein
LSPYITHGFVTLAEVLAGVTARHTQDVQHKFVFELGWRAYFRHACQYRRDGNLQSLHEGLLPDAADALEQPADIREACTGVPAVDEAVNALHATGMLHNHARMWPASQVVHMRKVHWRSGADRLYGHLRHGDLASNHLSWQWMAGTGSIERHLFNADDVARDAPKPWHRPGSVIETSYEALNRMARQFRLQGCHVAAVGRDAGRLPDVEAAVRVGADTTTPEGAALALAACQEALGVAPSMLAQCVSSALIAPLHRTRADAYRELMRVNLDSAVFVLQA